AVLDQPVRAVAPGADDALVARAAAASVPPADLLQDDAEQAQQEQRGQADRRDDAAGEDPPAGARPAPQLRVDDRLGARVVRVGRLVRRARLRLLLLRCRVAAMAEVG